MWWYLVHTLQTVACVQTFTELPVFEPNDYFWEHHWDGKEEKWLTYANVIREIIADQGGFKLSQSQMEDKFEYKRLVWGRKKKEEKTA